MGVTFSQDHKYCSLSTRLLCAESLQPIVTGTQQGTSARPCVSLLSRLAALVPEVTGSRSMPKLKSCKTAWSQNQPIRRHKQLLVSFDSA